jgi:hypothetical protein
MVIIAPGTAPLCGTVSRKNILSFPRHSDSVPKEAKNHKENNAGGSWGC